MTIEKAIKKAISGGWDFKKDMDWPKGVEVGPNEIVALSGALVYQVVCTRSFWKALGKSMGWEKTMFCAVCGNGIGRDTDEAFLEEWQYQWHHMIDHLAQGGTIEEFFNTL